MTSTEPGPINFMFGPHSLCTDPRNGPMMQRRQRAMSIIISNC